MVYRATTAWLVVLTWPLYLLAVIYGPEILSIFGHSYRAGDMVMVILGLTMLVATACGQVDMVLITTGRSSWSLANGLMAVGRERRPRRAPHSPVRDHRRRDRVGRRDHHHQPRPAGPAGRFEAAEPVRARHVHRGIGLAVVSFAVIPLAVRAGFGRGAVASVSAIAAGCLVQAAGLWRFRDSLRLAALPGASRLTKIFSARGSHRIVHQAAGD